MSNLHFSSNLVASSPLLSKTEAHLVAFTLTSAYVGGLYVSRLPLRSLKLKSSSAAHPASLPNKDETPLPDLVEVEGQQDLDRDDPNVIKSRLKAVSVATFGGFILLGGIVYARGGAPDVFKAASTTLKLLGLPGELPPLPNYELPSLSTLTSLIPSPSSIITFFRNFPSSLPISVLRPLLPYALAPALFAGPIFTGLLDKTFSGQRFGRKVLDLSGGSDGMFDCLRVKVPGWLRRLVGGSKKVEGVREDSADAVALERRRWVEFRNFVAGPVTEEIVFRAAIISTYVLADYTRPSDWKFLTFATPLWFGLAHVHHAYEVYKKGGRTRSSLIQAVVGAGFQLSYTTLFGWFAAYLFIKTDSIFPPIASHIFCNIMSLPDPVDAINAYPDRKISIIGAYIAGIAGFTCGLRKL